MHLLMLLLYLRALPGFDGLALRVPEGSHLKAWTLQANDSLLLELSSEKMKVTRLDCPSLA